MKTKAMLTSVVAVAVISLLALFITGTINGIWYFAGYFAGVSCCVIRGLM